MSINTTKFLPPRRQLKLLDRENLQREANKVLSHRLLLVSAPAGYGKTSTLVQLHERLRAQGHRAAWLSIDSEDNDLVRFMTHLVDAISRAELPFRSPLDGIRTSAQHGPGSIPAAPSLIIEFLNELAQLGEEVFLFFDDFHLINHPDVLSLVSSMLLAALPRTHLVIAAREVPELPIGRMRALGTVHEIGADHLAFSIAETRDLVRSSGGPHLSEEDIWGLCHKTEGWVASLQMALIALRGQGNPAEFLASFSGADRSIADFLLAEVLKRQPPPVQHFLLATSLLTRFSTGLANAILDSRDARAIIDHLEKSNIFIFSLDRDQNWYRYHHLFRDLLRKKISEAHPDLVKLTHQRAGAWLAENGYDIEAVEHAFAAGDPHWAGELIDRASTGLFASAQTATLSMFAARLPPEILRDLPRLQLELAWESIICWRFKEAQAALNDVRRQLSPHTSKEENSLPEAEAASLRIKLAHRELMMQAFSDHLETALEHGRQWVADHGLRDDFMGSSISVAMMMCRREAFHIEHTQIERQSLLSQFTGTGALYGTVFLDTVAGKTLFVAGQTELAEKTLQQGLASAVRLHGQGSNLANMPVWQLAYLLYEKNQINEARELIAKLGDASPAWGLADSLIARYTVLCRVASLLGDAPAAHCALDAATQLADRHALDRVHAHVAYERIRLLLAGGHSREATLVAADTRYAKGFTHITPGRRPNTTRLLYALSAALLDSEQGKLSEAITLLRSWHNYLRDLHCAQYSTLVLVFLARLQLRGGNRLAAQRSLVEALRHTKGGAFIRTFLDGGGEIKALLQELHTSEAAVEVCAPDYFAKLLSAFDIGSGDVPAPRSGSPEIGSALTQRELDILGLTAKHLVAREVASTLGMAESTVKWYWRRIFAKLGVHRRAAAVRIAQQRGLIP